jgi:hypothetical protein
MALFSVRAVSTVFMPSGQVYNHGLAFSVFKTVSAGGGLLALYQSPLIPTVRNRHALTRVLARPAPARAIGWGESPSAAAGITLRRLPIDRIETPRGATSAPIDGYGLDICRLLRLARDHRAAGDSWLESSNTRKPAGDGTARPLRHCAR